MKMVHFSRVALLNNMFSAESNKWHNSYCTGAATRPMVIRNFRNACIHILSRRQRLLALKTTLPRLIERVCSYAVTLNNSLKNIVLVTHHTQLSDVSL